MDPIQFVDLKKQYQNIKPEIDAAIQEVISNSAFILGKAVTDFETAFAKAHHVKHCVAVGSGTDAHAGLASQGCVTHHDAKTAKLSGAGRCIALGLATGGIQDVIE